MTTRGEINSNFYQIVNVDANGAPTSVKPEYLPNVGNANYAINAGHANIADSANSVAGANVTGTVSLAIHANVADLANSVAGANVTGVVGNATHATVSDSANLVAVANVSGIGNIATINLSGNGSQTLLGNGTWGALPNTANANSANFANYANFAGTAYSVAGGNVTGNVGNAVHAYFADTANLVAGANVTGVVGNATHATVADSANSVSAANIVGTVNLANYATVANSVAVANVVGIGNIAVVNLTGSNSNVLYGNGVFAPAGSAGIPNYANFAGTAFNVSGSNVSGDVAGANHANIADVANSVSGSNVSGQVANSLVAGTVYTNAQPNITSVGTLTDLSVIGNVTSGHFIGNASNVTGLSLTDSNFTDVLVTSPVDQQVLQYNGSIWVNNTLNIPTSAGSGVNFWFTTPVILPVSSNNEVQLDTLNNMPNTTAVQTASVNINNTTKVIMGTVTAPLNRTQFDAGNWSFDICAYANTAGAGTRTIQPVTYEVNSGSGTVTITGTGTTRTVTASSGTPFANSTGSANLLLCSHLQTSTGLFQINTKTSSTVVTIDVPTTYVNETSVSYFVYDKFFSLSPLTVSATSTTPTVYNFSTTASSLPISLTTRLGVLIVGTTNNNKILNVNYNDTSQSSHISTPFITLHDDLAGLQGGQTSEYFHLTQSEYTGTGSGVFVKQTNASLTTPNIDSATGTSLNLTGNLIAGNVTGGNLVAANYISGNGSLLTSITGANVSGQVANALVAGTVYTNAQPNITSVGTLTGLSVTGNMSVSNNISAANVSGSRLISTVPTGTAPFTVNSTTQVANLSVATAGFATTAGTVTTGAQPNITSLANTSLQVYNRSASGPSAARYLIGSSSQNAADNLETTSAIYFTYSTGTLNATIFSGNLNGTVTTAAQPNITSLGTLTSLSVTGNITTGNITSSGGTSNVKFVVVPTGGSITTAGQINSTVATGTAPLTVTSTTRVTNLNVATAGIANTVNDAAQPNITSLGTLTSLSVTGNVSANYYTGNGSLLTGITSTNSNYANFAGNVVNSSQPNITSVGTLTSLNVSGNIFSNTAVYIGNTSNATGLTNPTLVAKASGATYVQGALINGSTNGSADWVAYGDNGSDSGAWADMGFTGSNFSDPLYTLTGINDGYFIVQGDDTSAHGGNLVIATGQQGSTKDIVFGTGGFLTTNEKMRFIHATGQFYIQPTTVATDTTTGALRVAGGVGIAGDVYAGNIVSANYFVGDGSLLTGITATDANHANIADVANSVSGANVSGSVANATYANISGIAYSVSVGNVSGIGNIATVNLDGNLSNVLYGNGVFAAIPTVTSVANANFANFAGTAFNVSGGNVTGTVGNATHADFADVANSVAGINVTGTVANATYAITSGSATTAATVTTNAQPNITSLGSLTSLTVTGNITAGNINGGNLILGNYFSGNGSLLTSLTGANVTGTVANATYALSANTSNTSITVTGGAQPNITSVGSLTGLTVTGNVSANYYIGNGSALTGITATATPGGANTQIQYNNNGSMGGISTVTWNGSNISLGAVTTVKITGGSSGQVISTDGTGNLSFVAQSGGGGSSGFENVFLMMGA